MGKWVESKRKEKSYIIYISVNEKIFLSLNPCASLIKNTKSEIFSIFSLNFSWFDMNSCCRYQLGIKELRQYFEERFKTIQNKNYFPNILYIYVIYRIVTAK